MEAWKEEMIEREVQGRQDVRSMGRIIKNRSVSKEIDMGLRNSMVLPTLANTSDMDME